MVGWCGDFGIESTVDSRQTKPPGRIHTKTIHVPSVSHSSSCAAGVVATLATSFRGANAGAAASAGASSSGATTPCGAFFCVMPRPLKMALSSPSFSPCTCATSAAVSASLARPASTYCVHVVWGWGARTMGGDSDGFDWRVETSIRSTTDRLDPACTNTDRH